MKVHVLTEDRSMGGKGLNHPLRANQRELGRRGIRLRFFLENPQSPGIADCDALIVNSKIFRDWWRDGRKERMFALFERYREKGARILYFDTTDSTGTLQSGLFPFVDRYCKSFLLKDASRYREEFYGGRIFTEYYHSKFGITDREGVPEEINRPLTDADLAKLEVSWNAGLAFAKGWRDRAAAWLRIDYPRPGGDRPVRIACRMSVDHRRETIRYQRKLIAERLAKFGAETGRVGRREYLRELGRARIGISPFGWGEFAFRDFEIFRNGCALLKPDVSHMATWPDLYRPGETYVAFAWDLQDLDTEIEMLLSEPERAREIAEAGQELFRWYADSGEARAEFCDRLSALLEAR